MHPILFRIGPIEAHSYGLMLAISVLLGYLLARHRAEAAGIAPHTVFQLTVLMVIAIFVGSRLAYVLVNSSEFSQNWLRAIDFYEDGKLRMTGLVMNGGVLACLLVVPFFCRRTGTPALKLCDLFAPALALGIFLTRIGCFLNGCCYGKQTTLVSGIVFPHTCPAGRFQRMGGGEPFAIHPTQLYSSAYGLAIFVTLLAAEKIADRKGWKFDGFTTLLLFMLYPVARFGIEFLRHFYDETGVFFGLTHNQYLSVVLFISSATGMGVLARRHSRHLLEKNGGGPPPERTASE